MHAFFLELLGKADDLHSLQADNDKGPTAALFVRAVTMG